VALVQQDGARVVAVAGRCYGAALWAGIAEARGVARSSVGIGRTLKWWQNYLVESELEPATEKRVKDVDASEIGSSTIIFPEPSVKLHMRLGPPCQRSGNGVEADLQRTV